ncbi:type II toxin-antitoxin system PemK/MazF family toxin [Methanoplanus endosymbiosus]|uniref:Type II toxin-antitoxin system PemK/MazF family toxin n=1 Tax=Methanoplanus endosymbiosus TaxID=33865 RepID=A0A9E7TK24_9EURY|nr:type II toxin-antitoxin system PemK/MazF family toxin [Methanoplanus endosymbiosus]UUX92280.1 type II toxin-antitoxin system PemK/MazF family toxin [Methanoplanus endosymbiosus]
MGYRWSVYLVYLDPVIGSEQGKTRPALVISDEEINRILPVITILPVTSLKPGRKVYPNEVFISKGTGGLKKDSLILCHQIRAIDKRRIIRKLGNIGDFKLKDEILNALSFQLGFLK